MKHGITTCAMFIKRGWEEHMNRYCTAWWQNQNRLAILPRWVYNQCKVAKPLFQRRVKHTRKNPYKKFTNLMKYLGK